MTAVRVWLTRFGGLFRRQARDRALDDELGAHLSELVDDLMERGLGRAEALVQARRTMGGLDQIKEAYRDQRGWPFLDEVRQDLTLAFRMLSTHRASTSLALLALALGIGVSMAFFTIVNAICFRGLPIDRPDRVLFVATRDTEAKTAGVSYADFMDLRRMTTRFSGLAAYTSRPMSLADEGEPPERVTGSYVSAGTFGLLGVAPVLGRELVGADETPGAPTVAVLGHGTWISRYRGDRSVVGRIVRVNGTAAAIVGVMPEGFKFPSQTTVWLPITQMPGVTQQPRSARHLSVFGRLVGTATPATAHDELASIAGSLEEVHPATNRGVRFSSVPINDVFNGDVTDPVWLAFLTAGFLVLLVACANVANAMLARLATRTREVAIRRAIGATRARIVRQLLVESLVLAAIGSVAGLALAVLGVRLLAWSYPAATPLPYWITFDVDARVLGALLATCALSVMLFGLAPAWAGARVGVSEVLKEGGRHGVSAGRMRWWSATFLAIEFALTLVLVANAAMDLRREWVETGPLDDVDAAFLLSAQLALPADRYPTAHARQRLYERLDASLDEIGGVASATTMPGLPPADGSPRLLQLPGQPLEAGVKGPAVLVAEVGADFFTTLGVPLVAGRDLADHDAAPGQEGVVVSRHFADEFFPAGSVVGEQLAFVDEQDPSATAVWRKVIGVAPDFASGPLRRRVAYVPNRMSAPASVVLLVRPTTSPDAIAPSIRQAVASLDPDLAIHRVTPLSVALRESNWSGRVSQNILRTITGIAFVLAIVGLYAVVAHVVVQRTREIGIRTALGATSRSVVALILGHATGRLGLGLILGLPCIYVFERLFMDTTTGRSLTTPANLALTIGFVFTVAMVACIRPALRAAHVDPVRTLRAE